MQINLLDDGDWLERMWPPERPGYRWRRKRVAGDHLGASLFELLPGDSTFPYHYEIGNDELLVVVTGRPTLRTPGGERKLEPGDCVLFPSGPAGAHRVSNRSTEPVRVLLVSNFALPRAAVQVDSNKMMLRWGPARAGGSSSVDTPTTGTARRSARRRNGTNLGRRPSEPAPTQLEPDTKLTQSRHRAVTAFSIA